MAADSDEITLKYFQIQYVINETKAIPFYKSSKIKNKKYLDVR